MNFTDIPYYLCLAPLLFATVLIKRDMRWVLLLIFSIIFYGIGRWHYVLLLLGSIFLDYICAIKIDSSKSLFKKRLFLAVSVIANISILIFFKYLLSIYTNWSWIEVRNTSLINQLESIALPLGISFYTLQSMGYTIDVYRNEIKPEKHFGLFSLYVCFFPQLVAGPIERPRNLLPQLRRPAQTTIKHIQSGLLLITLGLAQKLIIADRLFAIMNEALNRPDGMLGWQAVSFGTLGMTAIYMDLSAYTHIARGSARTFGIELSHNFYRPFLARSLGESWQRWHISLTRWILNYVYKSLCSLSNSALLRNIALIFTFTLIGLWHGPTLPFLLLGVTHGCIIVIENSILKTRFVWPKSKGFDTLRVIRTLGIHNLSGVLFCSPDFDSLISTYQHYFYYDAFFDTSSSIAGEPYLKIFSYIVLGAIALIGIDNFKKTSFWTQYQTSKHSVLGNFILLYVFFMIVLLLSYQQPNGFFYFDF